MADRVELIIQLTGDKDALRSLSSLKSAADSLNKHKISLDFDKNNIRAQINDVRRELESIRSVARDLGVKPTDLQTYRDLQDRLTSLNQEMRRLQQESQLDSAGVRALNDQMNTLEASAQRTADAFNAIGNALISIGSASEGINNFAAGIGQAFSGMASIFQTNIIDNVERMLTYMATRGITGSLGNAINRYDILNTFSDYMQLAGVQADVAEKSLQRVNDAILGLPIGLDEAAQRLRRYQMFLGDVERATNLTIGIQNAIFAGGANEAARTTAYYQIDRLLTVGRLNTARQWNALLMGMGVSVRYVAEEMGYSFSNISDFAAGLSSGAISTDEFLSALERLGTGATDAGQRLQQALSIYKGTVDSWMRNISFAFQRGTANIMSALDETLEQASGRGITGYMERFRNSVNRFYAGGSALLRERPELMAQGLGSIERLIDAFSRFSGNELAVNVLQNLARFVDMLAQALDRLPAGKTEEFVAFAVTLAGPLGKLFATISSGLPVVLGVFQRFKDFDFEELLDKIMTQVERLAGVVSGLLNLIPDGLIGDLIAFGLVWGKPLAAALTAVGTAIGYLGTSLQAAMLTGGVGAAFAEGGFLAGLISLAKAHPLILAAAAAIGGTWYAISEDMKAAERSRREATDALLASAGFIDTTALESSSKATLESVRSMRKSWDSSLDEINVTSQKAREIAQEIDSLDSQIAEASGSELEKLVAKREVAVQKLKALDIELSADLDVSKQIEAWRNDAQRSYYEGIVRSATESELAIDDTLIGLRRQRDELRKGIEDLRKQRIEAENPELYIGASEKVEAVGNLDTAIFEQEQAIAGLEQQILLQEIEKNILKGNIDMAAEALTKLKEVQDAASEIGGRLSAAKWAEIREEAEKTIQKQLSGFSEMEKASAVTAKKIADNLGSQNTVAEQFADSLETALGYIGTHEIPGLEKVLQEMASQGLDATDLLLGIADAIEKGDDSAVQRIVDAYTERVAAKARTEDYMVVAEAIALGMNNVDLEELFGQVGEEGDHLILKWLGMDNPDATGDALAAQINRALEKARTGIDTGLPQPARMQGDTRTWEELFDEDGQLLDPLAARRKLRLGDGTDEMAKSAKKATDAIVKSAQDMSKKVQRSFDDANDSVGDFEDGVNDAASTMERRRSSADNLASSISNIGTQANIVVHALTSLKEAIDALQDKEVTLTVNTVENAVSGVVAGGVTGSGGGGGGSRPGGGGTPLPYATGGFLPRGTDTIAALLSPGEFVMRKGAVDAVGGAFLSRLNSLDIRGAIDSMMSRYYRPSSVATATSYTTNNYDQRDVTVNYAVKTNNPHYANRRIVSRFAHALR